MKIIHYIPSIDRSCGGTTEYVRLLAEKLGQQAELHVVTHTSQHPVEMEYCQVEKVSKVGHLPLFERVPAASVVRANLVSQVILIFRINQATQLLFSAEFSY